MKFAPLKRAAEASRYLRLSPFDQSTPEGRSAERYRRAAFSSIVDAGGKVAGMLLMFTSVALTVPYLGAERFGVWMTITSLTAMLSFLDLGMGNALINRVASAGADPDPDALSKVASSGVAALAVVGFCIGAILVTSAAMLPWSELAGIKNPRLLDEARHAAMVFGALFGVNMIATGVRSIFVGLQRSFEAHFATMAGYLAAILALWFAAAAKAEIPWLLLATFGVQVSATLVLVALAARRGILRWAKSWTFRHEAIGLAKVGGLFFALQIGAMVAWGGDSIMIAHFLGPISVAEFNVTLRLFQLVAVPLSLLTTPLWSAYADAAHRHDKLFINKTLLASFKLVLFVGLIGVVIVALGASTAINHWTQGAVTVPLAFVWAFGVWTLVQGLGGVLGVFLNGTGVIKPQLVAVASLITVGLPLKLYVLSNAGLTEFLIASIIAYLVTHVAVYSVVFFDFGFWRRIGGLRGSMLSR